MATLEEPLIPTPSNTGVQNFIAGFSMVAAANHKKEQEALMAQRLIEQRQRDEQAFELKSQISQQNIELARQRLEVDQMRAGTYAEHVQHELERQKGTVEDLGGLSTDIAEAQKYPLGSIARVQALEAAKEKHAEAIADIHGNRIFKPEYDEATRAFNNSLRDFNVRNQTIFGKDATIDPWNNNPNWTKEPDGRWRFPLWGYVTNKVKDPRTGQETDVSQPVKIKDVIVDDAVKQDMQKRFEQTYKGESSLPHARSQLDMPTAKQIADQIKAAHPDWTPEQLRAEFRSQTASYNQ